MVRKELLLFIILSILPMAQIFGALRALEIPEPMVFDLVRDINSRQGDWEVNSLFFHSASPYLRSTEIAPEIEMAVLDGTGIELELPTGDGKIKSFKLAFQQQLPRLIGDLNGLQLIYEKVSGKDVTEISPIYLIAFRFFNRWSNVTMLGNRFYSGREVPQKKLSVREEPIINSTLFFDYNPMIIFGMELNLLGVGASFRELLIMPQMHVLLENDLHFQAGYGAVFNGQDFLVASSFRLIKEFN
jgi:hypothetical protein